MDSDKLFEEIYLNIVNLKNVKDNALRIKTINIISNLLNKLKNYDIVGIKRKEIVSIVKFLDSERHKLSPIDRMCNKIDSWVIMDLDTELLIKKLKEKNNITQKEFKSFIDSLKIVKEQ